MRAVFASSLCCLLAACATVEPVPVARHLTQTNIEAIGPTRLSVTANETGVAKSWFYTETNGGGAGLAGAIGAAIAAAIINAAPSARAHRQATEVAEVQTATGLDTSLVDHLKTSASAGAEPARVVAPSEIVVTQKFLLTDDGPMDDVLEVTATYTLSEDSSVLRIAAVATYQNKKIPYVTRYTFEKAPPASEKKGPLYRNVFTYYSTPLPVPTLTPELKTRLVASTEDAFRDDAGVLPVKGSQFTAMQNQIALANDDKLTPTELSVFLTREWLKDDGALLKREIENAHAFIAKYVLLDVNRSELPSLKGEDELLETTADQRTVRRIGKGTEAGSYVSSAANVESFATYGNTVAVGKPTSKYIDGLKQKAGLGAVR